MELGNEVCDYLRRSHCKNKYIMRYLANMCKIDKNLCKENWDFSFMSQICIIGLIEKMQWLTPITQSIYFSLNLFVSTWNLIELLSIFKDHSPMNLEFI